jgi:hypothetical protein
MHQLHYIETAVLSYYHVLDRGRITEMLVALSPFLLDARWRVNL